MPHVPDLRIGQSVILITHISEVLSLRCSLDTLWRNFSWRFTSRNMGCEDRGEGYYLWCSSLTFVVQGIKTLHGELEIYTCHQSWYELTAECVRVSKWLVLSLSHSNQSSHWIVCKMREEDELGQNPNCADKKDACCPISANQGSEHWTSIGKNATDFHTERVLIPRIIQFTFCYRTNPRYWSVG